MFMPGATSTSSNVAASAPPSPCCVMRKTARSVMNKTVRPLAAEPVEWEGDSRGKTGGSDLGTVEKVGGNTD